MIRFHCVLLKQRYVLIGMGEKRYLLRELSTPGLSTSQSAVWWLLPGLAVLTSLSLVKGEDTPWRQQDSEFRVLSPGKLWPQASSSCCESSVHHRLET